MARTTSAAAKRNQQRMVHIRLEPELHRRLRLIVAAEDTSVQEWVAGVVEQAVEDKWPEIATVTGNQ